MGKSIFRWRSDQMKYVCGLVLLALLSGSVPTFADDMKMGDKNWVALEKTLEDVNNQWLCSGKYYKPKAQDCVDFRASYWPEQFFEVGQTGKTQTREQMVAGQTANAAKKPDVVRGTGPNPQDFKLMSVYGNIALATDHTVFKTADASGNVTVSGEAEVLRMFEKENGRWRPAGAVLIPSKK
ncbi:MAG: nuclear transport factor 2 family protein [Bryobacteraceae bacterium]